MENGGTVLSHSTLTGRQEHLCRGPIVRRGPLADPGFRASPTPCPCSLSSPRPLPRPLSLPAGRARWLSLSHELCHACRLCAAGPCRFICGRRPSRGPCRHRRRNAAASAVSTAAHPLDAAPRRCDHTAIGHRCDHTAIGHIALSGNGRWPSSSAVTSRPRSSCPPASAPATGRS